MVGSSGVTLVAAVFYHVVTSVLAAQVAETAANLAGIRRVDTALHTHAERQADTASRLRGLRSKANVFQKASSSRGGLKHSQVPLYVPKMGLANVTEPTPFPPPPPVLHPWKDMQPLDTAVGNYIIAGLIAQPTVTPPPSQSSLDLAFACPALLTWPGEVSVSAPDPCGSMESGGWNVSGGDMQVAWSQSCIDTTSPGITAPSMSPVFTYTMPNGDLFGTSQEVQTLFGRSIELRDCGGATVFTVEEKIYKQAGEPNADACAKYRSCDGVLYFQYFVKNNRGKLVALTGYTTIFQDSFDITDPAGGLIVQVSRNGWEPPDRPSEEQCADAKPRLWHLKYAGSPPGDWAVVTAQWPIAAMMTMLSARDQSRQPNGSVLWSNCQAMKTSGWILLVGVIMCCCVCIPMAIFLVCSAPILRFLDEAETRFLPKRMGKPQNYN